MLGFAARPAPVLTLPPPFAYAGVGLAATVVAPGTFAPYERPQRPN